MSRSQASSGQGPRPVRLGRYRYSKLRWRVSVRALDLIGAALVGVWRRLRPPRPVPAPRRILLVQLDHLGDAVLTSPLVSRLRAAYPGAAVDVLASASNHQVFEADPNVERVHLAAKTWFERSRGRWAMFSAVWGLGRSLRGSGYDLGIDVRGDILSVLVMTLAGIPRRVGWAMGGGGFLLTDVAAWVPGRHEVDSRLALLETLGIPSDGPTRVAVHVRDADRMEIARRLHEGWPEPRRALHTTVPRRMTPDPNPLPQGERGPETPSPLAGEGRGEGVFLDAPTGAAASPRHARQDAAGRPRLKTRAQAPRVRTRPSVAGWDEPDWLHAGRFGATEPLLAVHPGAGTAAKRWPPAHWRALVARFLAEGWRVVVVGGADDVGAASALGTHANLRDWTGRLSVTQTAALLERADLFIGADSGPSHLAASAGVASVILFSGTNRVRQWRPWSRRSLVLRNPVACSPCHQKVCPLAGHPCMSGLDPDRVHRAAKRWWARLHRRESPHAPI